MQLSVRKPFIPFPKKMQNFSFNMFIIIILSFQTFVMMMIMIEAKQKDIKKDVDVGW